MKRLACVFAVSVLAVSCAGKGGEETSSAGADAQTLEAEDNITSTKRILFSFDNNPATPKTRCWYYNVSSYGGAMKGATPLSDSEIPDAEVKRQVAIRGVEDSNKSVIRFLNNGIGLSLLLSTVSANNLSRELAIKSSDFNYVRTAVDVKVIEDLMYSILDSKNKQNGNKCWPADKVMRSLKL